MSKSMGLCLPGASVLVLFFFFLILFIVEKTLMLGKIEGRRRRG